MDNWLLKSAPDKELTPIRIGVFDDPSPPDIDLCAAEYLRDFVACTTRTNFAWNCTAHARPCYQNSPGPGAYVELLAIMLNTLRAPLFLYPFPKNTLSERLEMLANGTLDVIADGFEITADRFRVVRFTSTPFPPGHFGAIVREDTLFVHREQSGLWSVLRPFQLYVWGAFSASVAVSVVAFLVADVVLNGRRRSLVNSWRRAAWRSFVHLAGDTLAIPEPEREIERSASVKATIVLWSVLCFLIQSLYGGSITSYLVQTTTPVARFSTLGELATLIASGQLSFADYTNQGAFYDWLNATDAGSDRRRMYDALQAFRNVTTFSDSSAAFDAMQRDGRVVFKANMDEVGTFASLSYPREACNRLTLVDFGGALRWQAFAVNPARKKLQERLSRFVETYNSITDMLLEKYNMRGRCINRTSHADPGVNLRPLTFYGIYGTFVWLLVGLGVTLVALAIERYTHKRLKGTAGDDAALQESVQTVALSAV